MTQEFAEMEVITPHSRIEQMKVYHSHRTHIIINKIKIIVSLHKLTSVRCHSASVHEF